MLSLSKKVDYALLSLAYLVEHKGRISSARAIAETHNLPLPLLMNILKLMHVNGILCSERGSKGGYQICTNLDEISLYELIEAVEEAGQNGSKRLSEQPPLQALQYKVMQFLKEVRVSDLVIAGRRIDVPLDGIWSRKCRCHEDMQNKAKLAVTI